MLAEKTFDIGTVKINYAEGPPHGRPLILIHGHTSRWQTFLPVMPMLAFRYHVHALDLRGHGLSGRVPGAYRFVDYAEDIVRFLREKVSEPAALLGHSFGAGVAAQIAAEAPDLTYALILEEPAQSVVYDTWLPSLELSSLLRPIQDLLMTEPSMDDILSYLMETRPESSSVERLATAKAWSQMDPETITDVFNDKVIDDFQAAMLLPRIACPVLLIQGNPVLGGVVEDTNVEWTMSLLDRCIHVYLEDIGHGLHTPQPITFVRIVTDYLESL